MRRCESWGFRRERRELVVVREFSPVNWRRIRHCREFSALVYRGLERIGEVGRTRHCRQSWPVLVRIWQNSANLFCELLLWLVGRLPRLHRIRQTLRSLRIRHRLSECRLSSVNFYKVPNSECRLSPVNFYNSARQIFLQLWPLPVVVGPSEELPLLPTLVTEALLHYTIFFSRGIEFFEYVEYILLCLNMLGFLMCCQ